jgi:hypothetical protein
MFFLGEFYGQQNKLGEAEECVQRSLTGHEKLCGPEYKLTLALLTTLGQIFT